ncbi:MAG: hypothetical protein LBQ31_01170 [Bacteroidales bacterium]|jgi:hypothetical protein|nr:hypothetical protein [Bacteroidales bacterium]
MKTFDEQINLISRFLHCTTEPFDTWEWDGRFLEIYLKDLLIESYTYQDLKESVIPDL